VRHRGRRHEDEALDAGDARGVEEHARAAHVDAAEVRRVARERNLGRQVHDGIDTVDGAGGGCSIRHRTEVVFETRLTREARGTTLERAHGVALSGDRASRCPAEQAGCTGYENLHG
jgi:hypothetical protein